VGPRPEAGGAERGEADHFALARGCPKKFGRKTSTRKAGLDSREVGGTGCVICASNGSCKGEHFLEELLLESKDRPLGALPAIWQLQGGYDDDQYREEDLHDRLETCHLCGESVEEILGIGRVISAW
jgi:hypothetical protein